MSHVHEQTTGIVIHGSWPYDIFFGPLIRTTDAEILRRVCVAPGDHVLDVGTGPGYLALVASKLVSPDGVAVGVPQVRDMLLHDRCAS